MLRNSVRATVYGTTDNGAAVRAREKIKVPPRSAIMVDYDGVVLRSAEASKFVSDRCIAFAASKTGTRGRKNAIALNRVAYSRYGHTARGLMAMGYPVTLEEFNNYVYGGDVDYQSLLQPSIHDTFDGKGLSVLTQTCRTLRSDLYIWSNAPEDWVKRTSSVFGFDCEQHGIKVLTTACLKPDILAYRDAERKVQAPGTMILIDDQLHNVLSPCNGKTTRPWRTVLFGQSITKLEDVAKLLTAACTSQYETRSRE
jgi:FMN phosphatase YigB (HAD superfamily)